MQNKLLYTSDWHLGKRQYGLKHREQDRYKAAWYVVRYAVKHKLRGIVNGGDILDVTRPTSRAVNELKDIHSYLKEHDIPMFLVQGNHDKTDPPWFNLFMDQDSNPDKASGLILLNDAQITLKTKDQPDVTIYGLPEMPVDKMVKRIGELPKSDIFVTHITVRDWIGFPKETALQLSDIPKDRFKHVVIGDIHVTSINVVNGNKCISPGSIETGAKDEQREKYFQVANLDDFSVVSEQIPVRPVFDVRIMKEEDVEDGLKVLEEADAKEALVYLTYDPTIDGIVGRVNMKNTKPNTYIDMETYVAEEERKSTSEDGEEDGDELRTFESFAEDFTSDGAVTTAFESMISTDSNVDDIVQELESSVLETTEA